MGTKSIRHIVEATLATYLSTQTGLTAVTFLTGDSAATQTPPVPLATSPRALATTPARSASPSSPTPTTRPSPITVPAAPPCPAICVT